MAGQARSTKDKEMAAHLKRMGIYHGKRRTSPALNSGGLANAHNVVGSAKQQRRTVSKAERNAA